MPSTPFNSWVALYGLLKERPHRMAEKPVLTGTPGTPTRSLPNLKRLQGTPFKLPNYSFTYMQLRQRDEFIISE